MQNISTSFSNGKPPLLTKLTDEARSMGCRMCMGVCMCVWARAGTCIDENQELQIQYLEDSSGYWVPNSYFSY